MSDKIKELEEKINTIAYNINYLNSLMHSLGQGFTKYILWKGDEPEFKKHLVLVDKYPLNITVWYLLFFLFI